MTAWYRRLLASTLGGGTAFPPALYRGFAVITQNSGHTAGQNDEFGPSPNQNDGFGYDPQARYDYGYQQTGTLTPVAKSILTSFYGISPVYSYYCGCSNGGREAMVASQRWGDMFDGIVAGDPGYRLPHAAIAEAWDTQQFAQAALAIGTTNLIPMGILTFPRPQAKRTWLLWGNSCFRRAIPSTDYRIK